MQTLGRMAEPTPKGRYQAKIDLDGRAVEAIVYVQKKLFDRIERSAAVNMIVEKMGALEIDMQEAILFKDGRDREMAMLQALRRKLATYADDTSVDAEIGRAETALAKLHKAVAKKGN